MSKTKQKAEEEGKKISDIFISTSEFLRKTKWKKEFDKEFVTSPQPYLRIEKPYKIGDRNYTGEHIIYPADKFNWRADPGNIKSFIIQLLKVKISQARQAQRRRDLGEAMMIVAKSRTIGEELGIGHLEESARSQAVADLLKTLKEKGE